MASKQYEWLKVEFLKFKSFPRQTRSINRQLVRFRLNVVDDDDDFACLLASRMPSADPTPTEWTGAGDNSAISPPCVAKLASPLIVGCEQRLVCNGEEWIDQSINQCTPRDHQYSGTHLSMY